MRRYSCRRRARRGFSYIEVALWASGVVGLLAFLLHARYAVNAVARDAVIESNSPLGGAVLHAKPDVHEGVIAVREIHNAIQRIGDSEHGRICGNCVLLRARSLPATLAGARLPGSRSVQDMGESDWAAIFPALAGGADLLASYDDLGNCLGVIGVTPPRSEAGNSLVTYAWFGYDGQLRQYGFQLNSDMQMASAVVQFVERPRAEVFTVRLPMPINGLADANFGNCLLTPVPVLNNVL